MTNNADLRPKVKDHYRADKMALCSQLIPELMSNGNDKVFTVDNEDEDDGDVVTGGEGLLQSVFYIRCFIWALPTLWLALQYN